MKLIKETYLLFLIVIGLFSLSIYSTYSLFVEEYTIGIVSTNASDLTFNLSSATEYKRIDTYPGELRNLKLNLYNSTGNNYYYGVYVKSYLDCINLSYDNEYSDVRGYIENNISKTISLNINNTCNSTSSFNLYVITSDTTLDTIDKFEDGKVIITNSLSDASNNDINNDNTSNNTIHDIKLVNYIEGLYNSDTISSIEIEGETISIGTYILKDSFNNLRYYGSNPNNYISFNNELWRIIGTFYTENNSKQLVKIVREESIGTYSFNGSNWIDSNIKTLLNEGDYYNSIGDSYKNIISNNVYYLNSFNTSNIISAKDYYNMERNGSNNWTGKIGLMYPSDYIYSYYSKTCNYSSNYYQQCDSWLSKTNINELTIISSEGLVYSIEDLKLILSKTINDQENIRPVLYLDENVILLSGEGTASNPYVLS